MRISKLKIPLERAKEKNLKEIDLTKKPLGSIVALAGVNGAGKSRILKFVETYIQTIEPKEYLENYFTDVSLEIIGTSAPFIETALKQLNDAKRDNLNETQMGHIMNNVNRVISPFLERFKQLGQAYIKVIKSEDVIAVKEQLNSDKVSVSPFPFKSLLTNKHFETLKEHPEFITQKENKPTILLNEIPQFNTLFTIHYFKELAAKVAIEGYNLYVKNKHSPALDKDEINQSESFQLFNRFSYYIKKFLGKEFSYKLDSGGAENTILTFNNEPFEVKNLSPGQSTLFTYAVLFFYLETNSKTNIKESIIIIDEPELHLHPEAQILLINALRSIVSESGQLWIATHSLHILSELHHDEIILVDNDDIIHPSILTPAKTFNSLMGAEEHIHKLTQFVSSMSDWTYTNFIIDCFKEPEVIPWLNKKDGQVDIFIQSLKDKTHIEMLDYGAGKGRVGMAIMNDRDLNEKIDYYYALEPESKYHGKLEEIPGINRIYTEKEELPDDNFDIVLMCNVLHEIEPQYWFDIFVKIEKTLNDEGSLIIIEDLLLPKGEKANKYGFLLLDIPQLKILLGFDKNKKMGIIQHPSSDYKERLLCAVIQKEDIKIKKTFVLKALKDLREKTYTKIKKLRDKTDAKSSRLYAQYSQQYLNAKIAIEDMESATAK
ncbi:MAG TPA: AAA family ATPase [Bacteroidia bacterium]|nr:AAA family ATPase [Bacteroidia bacterium]